MHLEASMRDCHYVGIIYMKESLCGQMLQWYRYIRSRSSKHGQRELLDDSDAVRNVFSLLLFGGQRTCVRVDVENLPVIQLYTFISMTRLT